MQIDILASLPADIELSDKTICPVVLRPTGFLYADAAQRACENGEAQFLTGGPVAFSGLAVFLSTATGALAVCAAPLAEARRWAAESGGAAGRGFDNALAGLTGVGPPFAGLPLDRPCVMGIVNVTPDSFYAGSRVAVTDAVDQARRMIDDGAAIIDIGGESTRPGSDATPVAEELDRVIPVIEGLRQCGAVLSVDTRRAAVMRAAISAGASVINDITAMSDAGALDLVAAAPGVSVILMHSQGDPATMQNDPRYDHAPYEIFRFLRDRVAACGRAGIAPGRVAVDPGFGFGKTVDHNRQILDHLAMFHGTGCPVLAGVSRKSFLGALSDDAGPEHRLPATIAASIAAQRQGVRMHRVHDVKEVKQALLFDERLMRGK